MNAKPDEKTAGMEDVLKYFEMMARSKERREREQHGAKAETAEGDTASKAETAPKVETAPKAEAVGEASRPKSQPIPEPSIAREMFAQEDRTAALPKSVLDSITDPGVQVYVPSKGRFQPEGNLTFGVGGQVTVLPMTARDEILVHDPERLYTGDAIVDILTRRVPGLRDATRLPINDVLALLMGLRWASYGDKFPLTVTCPACRKESSFDLDIPFLMSQMEFLEDEYVVEVGRTAVRVHLRPLPLMYANRAATVAFEEARIVSAVRDSDKPDEEKSRLIRDAAVRMYDATVAIVSEGCIEKLVSKDGEEIDDRKAIAQWVLESPPSVWHTIQDKVTEIGNVGLPRTTTVECPMPTCRHRFEIDVSYDPVRFFAWKSSPSGPPKISIV